MNEDLLRHQAVLWGKLGRLVTNGVNLLEALRVAANETPNARLADVLREVGEGITAGMLFSDGLEHHPDLFPLSLRTMIRAGEAAGNLDKVLLELPEAIAKGEVGFAAEAEPAARETASVGRSPVVVLANDILARCCRSRASDIHLIPGEQGGTVRLRIDGVLRDDRTLDADDYRAVLSRLKIMAGMDAGERRLPQDGRIPAEDLQAQTEGKPFEFRVSTAQAVDGETMVLRCLDRSTMVFDLDYYVPHEDTRAVFRRWAEQPYGLAVVSGPAGSGKTTILYTLLKHIAASPAVKIMTVEQPVEIRFDGVVQLAVKPALGLTAARLLTTVLRHDPDVIVVGEIRDRETLELAVQAALTGHLVLTQLHTDNATDALRRMIDLGVPWWLLRDTAIGASSQRLVRCLCKECREPYQPTESELKTVPLPDLPRDLSLYRPNGCPACSNTGYRGRAAVYEIFEPGPEYWAGVERGERPDRLRRIAIEEGMTTLWDDAWRLVQEGEIGIGEVSRVLMGVER